MFFFHPQVWFQNRRNRNRRSANRNRKPTTAPLTLFETSDDARHAEIMSSAVKDPLFSSLPTLISPLPVSPTFHPRLFSMFHFSTSPVSPLPLTPVRSDVTFMFPEILPCRSWMKLSDTSTHFARPADYLCSSRFSPDSANEYSCDDSNTGDDDDDQLIIDFDACWTTTMFYRHWRVAYYRYVHYNIYIYIISNIWRSKGGRGRPSLVTPLQGRHLYRGGTFTGAVFSLANVFLIHQ